MRPTVEIKEEPVVTPPATSAAVAGTGEASQTLKKGPWTAAEDAILIEYVKKHGEGNWNAVQKNIGLQRCGKSCHLRWANHLRPNLKKGSFSPEEENLILRLHSQIGNKWARMAAQMPGRTDNEIKNYWNTRIKRRQRAGLPLYPPEIQRQEPIRTQKSGMLMFHQNQIRPKNFISHISPSTTTLFNPDTNNNNSTNYLLGNFNFSQPPQQLQSPTYSVKMEQHPLIPLFTGCPDDQKLQPPPMPPTMEQENDNVLFDVLFQKSQGPGEMYNEGLYFEPLSTSCTVITESSSPTQIDPLCKMDNSNFPIGFRVTKQPVERMVNQDVSNMPEMNPVHPTVMPMDKLISEWCDFSPPSRMTEDDLRVEMQQLASTLSMAHDLGFASSSWENMHSIR